MNKKILTAWVAVVLVLVMGLSFAGCKDKTIKNSDKGGKTSVSESTEQKPNELPPAEDSADGKTHKNDPNFSKDVTVVKDNTATSTDGKKDGEKPSDKNAQTSGEKGSPVEIKKDSYITVPVVLNKNPGSAAAMFTVNYDKTVFTYVDFESGEVFDGHSVNANDKGKVKVLLELNELIDIKDNGTLITLKFKVAKDAKAGTYSFKITDEMFTNLKEEALTPALTVGQAVIK